MFIHTHQSLAKILLLLFCFISTFTAHIVNALEPKVVQSSGLYFWTESFGKQTNPAIVLIMGSGGQGLLWPQAFCEQLADKGFFVIRYDQRDTGSSSIIDYQKSPYTLADMAKDITLIQDKYGIQKSHLVGESMGGAVATIFGANYPERTQSLTLVSTSPDMRAPLDAFEGKPARSSLSKPKDSVLKAVNTFIKPPEPLDEKVESFLQAIKVNSGTKVPVDEKLWRELALETYVRMHNQDGGVGNHFQAIKASYDLHRDALGKIKAPTRIIQGADDPVFQIDHGNALKAAIHQSKLIVIPGLGHTLSNQQFYNPVIDNIVEVAKEAKS